MSSRAQTWIPEPGTVLDERYRLGPVVDRGGMGVIVRAEHIRMKREVAVKLLSPDVAGVSGFRARFRREVDLSSAIDHPNIVRCYDFGETPDGLLYLVMELLDGCSLQAVLEREGRLDLRRAARLALQLLDGLAAAHLRDVVHRDLKPGNAFVVTDIRGHEVVKLLDFGLAKSLTADDVRITRTGAICGTASYLAPEKLVTQESTPAGDVYAMGLVMLEMVLGRKVFSSWSMAQTFLQQLTLPARIPRRIWDTAYGQLIASALQKDPRQRPRDAEAMFQALGAVIDDLPQIKLEPAELPPLPADDLSDSFLQQLAAGRAHTLDTLQMMPAPEPWDRASEPPNERQTQRFLMQRFEAVVDDLESRVTTDISIENDPLELPATVDDRPIETVEIPDAADSNGFEDPRELPPTVEDHPLEVTTTETPNVAGAVPAYKAVRKRRPRARPPEPVPQSPGEVERYGLYVLLVVVLLCIGVVFVWARRLFATRPEHPTVVPAHLLRPPESPEHHEPSASVVSRPEAAEADAGVEAERSPDLGRRSTKHRVLFRP